MDDIVKLVSQKAGIPEPAAKLAVETVVGVLKAKLPKPVAGQIDDILAGKTPTDAGGILKMLSGLFGGKK